MMRRSKYDLAVEKGFNVPRPLLVDFCFPQSFSRMDFEAKLRTRRTSATAKAFVVSIIYAAVLAFIGASTLAPDALDNPWDNKFGLFSFFALPFWIIYSIVKWRAHNALDNDEEVRRLAAYDSARAAWEAECNDWMESQLETGLVYWQEKRGVAFEHALMRLLQKRGCEVETTKVTGDGGVDLIVKMGSTVMWCQCKGHAKPISVAAIREIAGVCSRAVAQPAIFAVNGFTKPAQDTAKELGVQIFDAHHIVALAHRSTLTDVPESAPKTAYRSY